MKKFVFILLAAVISCTRVSLDASSDDNNETVPVKADSIDVRIVLDTAFDIPVRQTDIFVYDAEGTKEMESHICYDGLPEHLTLKLPASGRDRILVAICNFPFKFNLNALKQFDSMSLLSLRFPDDNTSAPVLSGRSDLRPDIRDITINLSPLMCTVSLDAVSNALDDYELLENPRIYLSGTNPEAEVLREKDFRPKEGLDDSNPVKLPYDIGFYTQNPGTVLFCYPNDTPEDILGVSRTRIVFECEITGKSCRFSSVLPPFGRGSSISAEITVFSPEDAIWKVNPRYSPSQTQ